MFTIREKSAAQVRIERSFDTTKEELSASAAAAVVVVLKFNIQAREI